MPNEGIAPPNFTTPQGQFRALIGDSDAVNIASGSGEYMWFSDAEINAFLSLYGDSVKRAAARALYTVASSQALLLKKFSADDLHVDGAAIAEALRKQAKDLNDEADAGDSAVDIFVLSTPGGNVDYVPEGFPVPLPKIGRVAPGAVPSLNPGTGWHVDGDGYVVDD